MSGQLTMINTVALSSDETKIAASFLMDSLVGSGKWSSAFALFDAADGTMIWAAINETSLSGDQSGKRWVSPSNILYYT